MILTKKSHNCAGTAFVQGDFTGGSKLIEQTLAKLDASESNFLDTSPPWQQLEVLDYGISFDVLIFLVSSPQYLTRHAANTREQPSNSYSTTSLKKKKRTHTNGQTKQ